MIACISPSFLAYEETVNTLKYANRAKNIKKKVEKNIKEVDSHMSEYKEIIESMRNEITFLQRELSNKNSNNNTNTANNSSNLVASRKAFEINNVRTLSICPEFFYLETRRELHELFIKIYYKVKHIRELANA